MLKQVGIRNTFSVEWRRHHHPCYRYRYCYYLPWAAAAECDSADDEYKMKAAVVGIPACS